LCEEKLPTYFISDEEKILSQKDIVHYDFHTKQEILTSNYLPAKEPVKILVTSGASCPDALVEGVINKLTGYYKLQKTIADIIDQFK
jgi:4-hydroxy-3-methylbut-2-enyl diphosphate reductase